MQSWAITNKPKAGLYHNLAYCRVLRCMSQDCRSGKVSTFKYQFDNLWDAEGVDLQLNEVYADGTQANNGMFYFSKKIDLSSVPFNVDERGFAILNPVMDWLNTSDQWQTFRFQVDVLDNTCIDKIENTCMGVLDSQCIDELGDGCKRASTYKDISVPPDPTHSIPEILVDSFSTAWQENHVQIDLDIFESERVNGFTILRRRSDEQTFAPLHSEPLTILPAYTTGDNALRFPVRLGFGA